MKILKKYVVKIDSNKIEDFTPTPSNEIVVKDSESMKGVYAFDPHDSAPHVVNVTGEGKFVTYKDISGKSNVIFSSDDESKIKQNKCFISIFDKKQFKKLRNGDYFSQTVSKPITHLEVIDSIRYIQQQGWTVKFSDNIYSSIKKLNEAGVVWQGTGIDLERLRSLNETQTNKKDITENNNIALISDVEAPKPKIEKEPEVNAKEQPKEKAQPKQRKAREKAAPKEKPQPKKRGRKPSKPKDKLTVIEPVQSNLSTDVIKSKYKYSQEETKQTKARKTRKTRVKKLKPLRKSKVDREENIARLNKKLRKNKTYNMYYGGYIPGLSFDDDMSVIQSHVFNKLNKERSKNQTASKENVNNEALYTGVSTNKVVKVKKGDSIADVLSKLYGFLYKQIDDQKKKDEIKSDFEKERDSELKMFLNSLVKRIETTNEEQQKMLGYKTKNESEKKEKEEEKSKDYEWLKDVVEVATGVGLSKATDKLLAKLKNVKIPNIGKAASNIASKASSVGSSFASRAAQLGFSAMEIASSAAMIDSALIGGSILGSVGAMYFSAKQNEEARNDINNPEHENILASDKMRKAKGENKRSAVKSQKYDPEIQNQLDEVTRNNSSDFEFKKEQESGFQDQTTRRYGNDLMNQRAGTVTPAKEDKLSLDTDTSSTVTPASEAKNSNLSKVSSDYDMNQQVSGGNTVVVNSPSTNIINAGGSSLSVEKLTGVRTTESTLKKIHMQNYRWV